VKLCTEKELMEAYLDNSATTRVSEAVKDIIVRTMMVDYGNPSSRHQKGVDAERYVRQARERIAATLKVKDREIYFTSGGTESNNWALIGGALANRRAGKHIITTAVEHAAVLQPLSFLKDMGFRITYLPVDEHGHISLDDLKAQLDQDTILVSTMYVNNEIGAVEPIPEIGELVKEYNDQILFHVDAIQAYGKYRIFPEKLHIDMLSVSGHKIHGPKGSGFLYIHEKAKVRPFIYGGGQQRGMRSGTENVPGCAGLGVAAMEAYTDFERKVDSMRACKKRLMEGLSEIEGAHIISLEEEAPQIVSCSFEGVRSEVFLHALEEKGVYVSSGSACSSNKKTPVSTVLQEIHLSPQMQDSTLRFSFCDTTSFEEIDYALSCIRELYPVLKRYMRR
jgi:cysteine desulfurase